MKPRRVILVALLAIMALAILGGWWVFKRRQSLVHDPLYQTVFVNMESIRRGVMRFDVEQNRLPVSLQEVGEKGLLPATSSIYHCPLDPTQDPSSSVSFSQTVYEIRISEDEVTISIPEELAQQPAYIDRIGDVKRYGTVRYHQGSVSAIGDSRRSPP